MDYIKSALHNLSKSEKTDQRYCRGIVVGIVSALMDRGWSYREAIAEITRLMPLDPDDFVFPPAWVDDIRKELEGR